MSLLLALLGLVALPACGGSGGSVSSDSGAGDAVSDGHTTTGEGGKDGGTSGQSGQTAMALVSGGVQASSANYQIITTTAQSPGGNGTSTSNSYTMTGGVVAATQGN